MDIYIYIYTYIYDVYICIYIHTYLVYILYIYIEMKEKQREATNFQWLWVSCLINFQTALILVNAYFFRSMTFKNVLWLVSKRLTDVCFHFCVIWWVEPIYSYWRKNQKYFEILRNKNNKLLFSYLYTLTFTVKGFKVTYICIYIYIYYIYVYI